MTDEELTAIRERADRWMTLDVGKLHLRNDVLALLAEVDALREIARAVATLTPSHVHSAEPGCFWCGGMLDDDYGRADPHAQTWRHADGCPVTKARALLREE